MRFVLISILFFITPLENIEDNLKITYNQVELETIDREQYSVSYTNNLFINESKFTKLLENLNERVYKDPVNAMISDKGEIIPDKVGYSFDEQKFSYLFRKFLYEGNPTIIEVPTKRVYSRVTGELLANIYVEKIGSFSTYYKEDNTERSHNIVLSTKAINNHVVFPEEIFSFNKVVGERTELKGYLKAPVIVKGEFTEDIGGGICQVSSTLFNAVSMKGVQIVERYSHSRIVPYVPPGKDAAVSWWGPDFTFKNKLNEPILIRAKSANGKVKIDIYSAENATYDGI